MLKAITLSIGIAAATALAQPSLALNSPSYQPPARQQPANNLQAQVVVSFPSAAIKIGSTTVILGQPERRDRYQESRYERRERRRDREYHRDRRDGEDVNDRQDRDSDDRH